MKKYELTIVQGKNIVLDVSRLLKEEVLYINATKLAKQFGKRIDNYLRLNDTKEYIQILNTSHVSDLELVTIDRGKYGGTYLHNDLIIHFLRWLNTEFAVKCDLYIKHKIQQAHDVKIEARGMAKANSVNEPWLQMRDQGKTVHKALTDRIQEFCKYAETQRGNPYDKSCPFYILVNDAIYTYLDVEKPIENKTPRDIFSGAVLEDIVKAESEVIELLDEIMSQNRDRNGIKKQILDRLKRNAVGNSI